jgi:thymidine phosphorylase
MDTPLGEAAGNWLEIRETAACLEGRGPADLREIVLVCAAHLLLLTKRAPDLSTALRESDASLASGAPLRKWEEMLAAQGANLEQYRAKLARDTTAPAMLEIKTPASGFVQSCNAKIIGEVIRELGGGRLTKDSKIDYDVGVDLLAKPGDQVTSGAPLARIHGRSLKEAQSAAVRLQSAFSIGPDEPAIPARISEVINT